MAHEPLDITKTKLFSLYFHELWWLSSGIKKKSENIFLEAKVPDSGYLMQVSPEVHSLIASILSDAANIKKLLITPSARLNGESAAQARLRKARAGHLANFLKAVELKELLNHKVRNTLEHFDEYLDEANLRLSEVKNPPSPMAAYNMILSHWDVISPRIYPVRVYISSERKFYNMKWSVDIGQIYQEACAILEALGEMPEFKAPAEPGGLMIPIG